jgi:hypothetical protein
VANALLITLAKMACGSDPDECEKMKEKLLDWLDKNKWADKYINNLVPWLLTAWLAYQRQQAKDGGMLGVTNPYKRSPVRDYFYNFIGMQEKSQAETLIMGGIKAGWGEDEKAEEGKGDVGRALGQYLNINPIPYRFWKDAYTLYHGVKGDIKQEYVPPKSIGEGYMKFGMKDWPKLEEK